MFRPGGRVAREAHARRGGVAGVAEDHRLDGDRGAPFVRDALDAAILDRARPFQLWNTALTLPHNWSIGSSGNGLPRTLSTRALNCTASSFRSSALSSVSSFDALLLLHRVHESFELLADALLAGGLDAGGLLHHHVGVHHDQAAIGVVDEARVVGLGDQAGDRARGEADVEDRLHHAGHRGARAGADRDEQRVLRVAELLAHDLFGLRRGRPRPALSARPGTCPCSCNRACRPRS